MTQADTLVSNWQMKAQTLAGMPQEAEAAIQEIEAALGTLYNQAETAGDERAKSAIMAAWGRAQQLHAQEMQLLAVADGAGATMQALADQRNAIAEEYESLMTALATDDWHDDRLVDFVESISEWVEESATLYMEDAIAEEMYDDISGNFRAMGLSLDDASRAVDLLRGEVTLNAEQIELLKMLLDSTRRDHEDMAS